jgi:hypothetical protein
MKTITDRLWNAVVEVTKLRHPSIGEILRRRRFDYEAARVDELIAAFGEMKRDETGNG